MSMKRSSSILIMFTIISAIIIIFGPFIGISWLTPEQVLMNKESQYIFFQYRIPRLINSYVAGSILALCGLIYQSVFANPLATPFTLGIASAASFGAILTMILKLHFQIGIFDAAAIGALIMALLSIAVIFSVSKLLKIIESYKILLLGVAMNFLFTSLILFCQFKIDYVNVFKILQWLVGSISRTNYEIFLSLLAVLIFCGAFIFFMRKEMDLLSLGEEFARTKGVNVDYIRWLALFVSSIMIAFVVASFGPIAFIGLIVPNVVRMLLGAKHINILWGSILIGGVLLSFSDILSRTIYAPVELPVGIVTSFIGSIFFIFLLLRKQH